MHQSGLRLSFHVNTCNPVIFLSPVCNTANALNCTKSNSPETLIFLDTTFPDPTVCGWDTITSDFYKDEFDLKSQ